MRGFQYRLRHQFHRITTIPNGSQPTEGLSQNSNNWSMKCESQTACHRMRFTSLGANRPKLFRANPQTVQSRPGATTAHARSHTDIGTMGLFIRAAVAFTIATSPTITTTITPCPISKQLTIHSDICVRKLSSKTTPFRVGFFPASGSLLRADRFGTIPE